MTKIMLISADESLYAFCRKLHDFNVVWVSPDSHFMEEPSYHVSLVLFDFELIKSGCNSISEKIVSFSKNTLMLPLVKECSLAVAFRLLKFRFEDIVALPCCIEYLHAYVSKYLKKRESLSEGIVEDTILSTCIGMSNEMIEFKKKICAVANNDLPVLILGETGTGKSFVARLIHQLSNRHTKKFVEENIAAIQETLVEGELFGTKAGAYTDAVSRIGLFEHANNGTLFLDEISCAQSSTQAKLLQVLETGMYRPIGSVELQKSNVRLICATNLSLELLKNKEIFREDLYYRISGIQLHVPALRNRKEDIFPLAQYFLKKMIEKYGVEKELTTGAIAKLESHNWPGNVRELERCIECAYHMVPTSSISGSDIVFVF